VILCTITHKVVVHARRVAIQISWADHKLEKHCSSSDREGQKRWGSEHWKVLKRRLQSLRAAQTLASMENVPGNCHALTANRKGEFAVDLRGANRLIFRPDHDPVPKLEDGGIDRSRVTRIVIEEVADYHGD
jgi:toxin HigB-1